MGEGVAQTHVQGDMDDAESVWNRRAFGVEHHAEVADAKGLGENLRVPWIRQACGTQSFLVQRAGDDRFIEPMFEKRDCLVEELIGGPTRGRTDHPGFNLFESRIRSAEDEDRIRLSVSVR